MELDLSELNIVLSVLGAFILLSGLISIKVKDAWSLGQALPAVVMGILLGPAVANFIDVDKWSSSPGESGNITLGIVRVMIGVQLVIAGYQLPSRYIYTRIKEVAICVIPVMGLMWLFTTLCMLATLPKLTLLANFIIASCVTSTDPVLSQAIAKGPFADRYVARPLREIISAEAGINDGFGVPFLMLAVYMMRYAEVTGETRDQQGTAVETEVLAGLIISPDDVSGKVGESLGDVMKDWVVESWVYMILLGIVYGAVVGFCAGKVIKFALHRRWIDDESYLLFPLALGFFTVGTCGAIGTDDFLACFVAGHALNWDGEYLAETQQRRDDVNGCVDALLNFGGFLYIGTIIPWSDFHDPDGSGLTYGRLFALGFLVLVFRRIPAMLLAYRLMPRVIKNWKEAFFMGYFGPIGCGAIYYLEYTKRLFPTFGAGDEEQGNVVRAINPVVCWLVLFSVVVHGLSIPCLALAYKFLGIPPIETDAVEIRRQSVRNFVMVPSEERDADTIVSYNRFFRPESQDMTLPTTKSNRRSCAEHCDSRCDALDDDRSQGWSRQTARRVSFIP